MKEIPLTNGLTAVVDDEDFERVARLKWFPVKDINTCYARTYDLGRPAVSMHRFILGPIDAAHVDHADSNGLNNQRANLRPCTVAENAHNQGVRKNNTSGFKGVCWDKDESLWRARITVERKRIYLGKFKDPTRAALAYDRAAVKFHGQFARLNFPGATEGR